MADDPDKSYSNVVVTIAPDGKLNQLGPDLEEKELAAIGWVTAHWAILEHYLLHQSMEMAEARGAEPAKDVFNLSFARRRKAWLEEIRLLPDGDRKTQLEKLSGKIANCEDRRHKTTHGLWAWDLADPDQLKTFSKRPRVEFEIRIDDQRIHRCECPTHRAIANRSRTARRRPLSRSWPAVRQRSCCRPRPQSRRVPP